MSGLRAFYPDPFVATRAEVEAHDYADAEAWLDDTDNARFFVISGGEVIMSCRDEADARAWLVGWAGRWRTPYAADGPTGRRQMTLAEFAEKAKAVADAEDHGRASAAKRGRWPDHPYVAIIVHGSGRFEDPLARAYATRDEAVAAAQFVIEARRSLLYANLLALYVARSERNSSCRAMCPLTEPSEGEP
jgi:hypothetical protein